MKNPEPPPLPEHAPGRTASPPPLGADRRGTGGNGQAAAPPPASKRAAAQEAPQAAAPGDSPQIGEFLSQAEWVLADERGMTAKAQVVLASMARDLGLDERQADEALRSLQQPPRGGDGSAESSAETPPETPPEPLAPEPPPAEPAASPPRHAASPQLRFRAYVGEVLAKSSRDRLSPRKERRLIDEGTGKLGLAEVFARQIVHEVAAAMGKQIHGAAPDRSTPAADHPALPAEAGEFLEQAAAILTEQRGITAHSRVLLTAAAARSGLSDLQMEQALQLLQGESDFRTAEAWRLEREQAFSQAARAALARLPHKLFTARVESQWLEAGQQRYGVPLERAAELIRQAAQDGQLRIVSADRAREHIYEVAAGLLDQGYLLDRSTRNRLVADAAQWGLTADQVQEILADLLWDQQRADSIRRRLVAALVIGAAGLLGVSALVLAWSFLGRGSDTPAVQIVPFSSEAQWSLPDAHPPREQQWWAGDEDLLIAATKLRILLPRWKEPLLAVGTRDEQARGAAYRQLVGLAAGEGNVRLHAPLLREFFGGCLVHDPADSAAAELARALLDLVPTVGDRLPEDEEAAELPFWAIRTLCVALDKPRLSDARAAQLAQALSGTLGVSIDSRLDSGQRERQCISALCQHLYSVSIAAAPGQLQAAPAFHATVTRHASRWLDASYIEQRTLDLLGTAVPAAGEHWQSYQYLLQATINSNDPLVVLQMVDLYERVSDPPLREILKTSLLRRVGVYSHSFTPEEVARRVREALGAKQVVSGRQRWNQLDRIVEQLAPLEPQPQPDLRLQTIVDTAYAATLACALSQGDLGFATFDDLHRNGPVRLSRLEPGAFSTAREAARPRQISASLYQSILSNIQQLNDSRNRKREYIPIYLRNLAVVAPQLPELPPEHAAQLARYLLSSKNDKEHQAVLQHADALTRWRNVRLCLMDEVLRTSGDRQRVVEVISAAVRRDLSAPAAGDWRQPLRDVLLRGLIDELALTVPRVPSQQGIYDELRETLRDLYTTQARLLGVPAESYAAASTPADLLQLSAQTYTAAPPAAAGQPVAAASPAGDWSAQLAALEYAAENDLQRTVLLQRLWLRALAAGLAQRGKIQPGQADPLLAELQQADRQAADAIAQLHWGERTHLQIWLLTRPGP